MDEKKIFNDLKKERDEWLKEKGKIVVKNHCSVFEIDKARRERKEKIQNV